jgi:cytochrome c peroxidase
MKRTTHTDRPPLARSRGLAGPLALLSLVLFVTACDDLTPSDFDSDDPAFQTSANGTRGQLNGALRSTMTRRSPGGGLDYFRLPDSDQLRQIPQDPKNPLSSAKVTLGQLLFHETALAVNNLQNSSREGFSCASCHHAQGGFQANLPQGIAEGGVGFGHRGEARTLDPLFDASTPERFPDVQPIRSPTAMNGAYQEANLWNGQFGAVGVNVGTEASWTEGTPKASNHLGLHGLETQAHAALAVHRIEDIEASRVYEDVTYQRLFRRAFPGEAEPINRYNAALAIGAYERVILSNQAPFQRWLRGDVHAMSEPQYRGALLFFGKAECSTCHTGPALSSMTFYALGMNDLDRAADPRVTLAPFGGTVPDDVRRGRGGFTGDPADDYTFKTPQLYNLLDSPFYGHGASFTSVRAVVEYKNAGVPENEIVPPGQLAAAFRPLGLTEEEVDDLVAFLEEGLYDPNLMRYAPLELPTGNCPTVNDPQSQLDLQCGDAGFVGR